MSAVSQRLEGRTILVSGGASGIGRAVVARCLAEGARIAVADLTLELSKGAIAGVDPRLAVPLACDVTNEASARAAVAAAPGRLRTGSRLAGSPQLACCGGGPDWRRRTRG